MFPHPSNICSNSHPELKPTGSTEELTVSGDGKDGQFRNTPWQRREIAPKTLNFLHPKLAQLCLHFQACVLYLCFLLDLNLISISHVYFYTLLCVNLLRKHPPTSATQTHILQRSWNTCVSISTSHGVPVFYHLM